LLTGQKPFDGPTPKDILDAQLNRAAGFVAPRQINPDIPPGLEKSILRCLETDPAKRYPDMSMLVYELKTTLYVS
jgi:serine/threonine-protein kinase